MDKLRSKQLWDGVSIPTPEFVLLDQDSDFGLIEKEMQLPLIVKPVHEGSSLGMSLVSEPGTLGEAWRVANEYDKDVIAEKWIDGAEYTAAILGRNVLPLIKLETDRDFYDYEAKYVGKQTNYICPCGLAGELESDLQKLAMKAFDAVEASDWGRVDFMLDNNQQPWLIEVNTVPGMTDHSLVPMAAKEAGIDFNELVWRILETSVIDGKLNKGRPSQQHEGEELHEDKRKTIQ
jgi:D-alanine-D-alanine ligase